MTYVTIVGTIAYFGAEDGTTDAVFSYDNSITTIAKEADTVTYGIQATGFFNYDSITGHCYFQTVDGDLGIGRHGDG